jgi:hypothetical protein
MGWIGGRALDERLAELEAERLAPVPRLRERSVTELLDEVIGVLAAAMGFPRRGGRSACPLSMGRHARPSHGLEHGKGARDGSKRA